MRARTTYRVRIRCGAANRARSSRTSVECMVLKAQYVCSVRRENVVTYSLAGDRSLRGNMLTVTVHTSVITIIIY